MKGLLYLLREAIFSEMQAGGWQGLWGPTASDLSASILPTKYVQISYLGHAISFHRLQLPQGQLTITFYGSKRNIHRTVVSYTPPPHTHTRAYTQTHTHVLFYHVFTVFMTGK